LSLVKLCTPIVAAVAAAAASAPAAAATAALASLLLLLLLLLPLFLLLQIAAETIGAPVTSMLAVQVAGATIGNMICINNILVRSQASLAPDIV
jgi:hypothetical protein